MANEIKSKNEIDYHLTKRMMQQMVKNKIISQKEYEGLISKFKEEYAPIFDLITD